MRYTTKYSTKKISFALAAIAIALALIIGGSWLIGSLPALLSSQQLRTEQQVQDAYNNGFNDGISNYTELNEQITELKSQAFTLSTTVQKQQTAFTNIVSTLMESALPADTKQRLLADVEGGVYELAPYLAQLNSIVSDLQAENYYLKHHIAELEKEQSELLETITGLQNYIDSFEMIQNSFVIEFWNGIKFHFGATIPQGTAFDITDVPEFENTAYQTFLGWSLQKDGGVDREIFDFSDWTPEDNTKFYAVFQNRYDVNFVYDFESYTTRTLLDEGTIIPTAAAGTEIDPADLLTVADPADTPTKKFLGWSTDGTTVIDLSTYPIMKNTTFFAVLDLRQEIKFVVEGRDYAIYMLELNSKITPPKTPSCSLFWDNDYEYDFDYWEYDGRKVKVNDVDPGDLSFNNMYVTGPMVFVAHWRGVMASTNVNRTYNSSNYSNNTIILAPSYPITGVTDPKFNIAWMETNYTVQVSTDDGDKNFRLAAKPNDEYEFTVCSYKKYSGWLWINDEYVVTMSVEFNSHGDLVYARCWLEKNGKSAGNLSFTITINNKDYCRGNF